MAGLCSKCGSALSEDAKFCAACGANVAAPPAAQGRALGRGRLASRVWRGYRRWPRWVQVATALVAVFAIIGLANGTSKSDKPAASTAAASATVKTPAAQPKLAQHQFVVPGAAVRNIRAHAAQGAYLPTFKPAGYRYTGWKPAPHGGFEVSFARDKAKILWSVEGVSAPASSCGGGVGQTIGSARTVSWSPASAKIGRNYWMCLGSGTDISFIAVNAVRSLPISVATRIAASAALAPGSNHIRIHAATPKKKTTVAQPTSPVSPEQQHALDYISQHNLNCRQISAYVSNVELAIGATQPDANQIAQLAQSAHDFIDSVRLNFTYTDSGALGDAEGDVLLGSNDLKNAMGAIVAYTGDPNPATLAEATSKFQNAAAEWDTGVRAIWATARRSGPPTV